MKAKFYILHIKQVALYGTIICLIILLLLESPLVMQAVQKALFLCYKTVIPSLFPFFILSGMLTASGFVTLLSRVLSPIMQPIFRVNGAGALPFAVGIISGYPMGAKITAELYSTGLLSMPEARRLLPFTNNGGPLFIIGAVGTGMLGQPLLGGLLYGVHVLSALLVGICFRFYGKTQLDAPIHTVSKNTKAPSFSEIVAGSIHTMLLVCGFIVFFSAITACITPLLDSLFPDGIALFLKTLPEVTTGALLLAESSLPPRFLLTLISSMIGFGGFCVAMQVAGIITSAGLSIKSYIIGKILQGCFSGIITYAIYPLIAKKAEPVFSPILPTSSPASNPVSLLPVILVLIFLCFTCRKKRPSALSRQKS